MFGEVMRQRIGCWAAMLAVLGLVLGLASTALAGPLGTSVNPILWLDAGTGVIPDDGFGNFLWQDQSGGGHDATQSTAAYKPTPVLGVINGKPVVRFDGTGDSLSIPDHNDLDIGTGAGKGWTGFFVYNKAADSAQRHFVHKATSTGGGSADTDYTIFKEAGVPTSVYGTGSSGDAGAWMRFTEPPEGAFHVLAADLNQTGSTSGTKRVWANGSLIGQATYANKRPATSDPLFIGRHPNAGLPTQYNFKGDIAEVIVFNSALSYLDRFTVQSYLQGKYAMPLPPRPIDDVSASASSYFPIPGIPERQNPIHAVSGAGLTETWHTNNQSFTMWHSAQYDIDGAYITIDLKQNHDLMPTDTLRIWNYNHIAGTNDYTTRGMRDVEFSYLADDGGPVLTDTVDPVGGPFTPIDAQIVDQGGNEVAVLNQATGSDTYWQYDTVNFGQIITARYIRITALGGIGVGNWGDVNFVGLSEVQVFAVPEPGTLVLLGLGLVGLALFGRQRKR